MYGNAQLYSLSDEQLMDELQKVGLNGLLERFEGGLKAEIKAEGDGISLGQKQIIAFMRAVIRRPDLLILDEATAKNSLHRLEFTFFGDHFCIV